MDKQRNTDTDQEFFKNLWRSWGPWTEGPLNWKDLDLHQHESTETLPNLESQLDESGELFKQKWQLQDNNYFYYPLFGLGSNNLIDIQVAFVAASPGHNVGSHNEKTMTSKYRECIHGPLKNPEEFNPEDEYAREFQIQKNDWQEERNSSGNKPNMYENIDEICGKIDNMELFENMYYTNFLKDGEYSESVNNVDFDLLTDIQLKETRGVADEICEAIAREFWRPVLGVELTIVEPDVIVPIGKKATEAVGYLYDIEVPHSLKDISLQSVGVESVNSNVTIIPSYHLSNYSRNVHHIEIDNLDVKSVSEISADTYLEALSEQIAKHSDNLALVNP